MIARRLALAATAAFALALPGLASAQFIDNVVVEPAQVKVGETAKITVNFKVDNATNCGLRLSYGDGTRDDVKINQRKDVPWVTTRAWKAPGEYRVKAEGKAQLPAMAGCGGKNQEFVVKVVAAAAPAKAAAAAKPAAASAPMPTCPEGWKLDPKSVNRKTGAYTCAAAAGTKPPAAKLECKGDTGYFENAKRGQLGCRL